MKIDYLAKPEWNNKQRANKLKKFELELDNFIRRLEELRIIRKRGSRHIRDITIWYEEQDKHKTSYIDKVHLNFDYKVTQNENSNKDN